MSDYTRIVCFLKESSEENCKHKTFANMLFISIRKDNSILQITVELTQLQIYSKEQAKR